MNRKFKFRIWDLTNKEWLVGDDEFSVKIDEFGQVFKGQLRKDTVIQQFTGLKDKNGKEIYEGDIIVLPDDNPPENSNSINLVEYLSSAFVYKDVCNNKIQYIYDLIGKSKIDGEAYIIGNIFENPELLKN